MWSLENPSIRNGILAGMISAGILFMLYLIKASWVFSPISFITTVVFIFLMVQSVKAEKSVREFTSFSDALKPAFLTYVVGHFLYIIAYFVLLNFVAPDLADMQREIAEKAIEKMGGLMGEEAMEAAIERLETESFDFTFGKALMSFGWGLIFPGFIIAAIIAAVMKDKRSVA